MFAATRTPALRGARWWRSARSRCRTPGRPHACARAAACTRVFPVPAGPVTTSTVRAEDSTCQTAAASSSRSPLRVGPCSRASCRALTQLRRQQLRRRLPARRAALSSRLAAGARLGSAHARRAAPLPTAARQWRNIARCPAACRRCGRPAPGAATGGAAAIAGASRHTTSPPRPDKASSASPKQAAPVPPAGSSRRGSQLLHHQGELFEQVVPGPCGLLLRHQCQRLGRH